MTSSLGTRIQKIEIQSSARDRLHVILVPAYPADASEVEKKTCIDAAIRDYEQSHGRLRENDVAAIVIDSFD